MPLNTRNQTLANHFDLQIFNLAESAALHARDKSLSGPERIEWDRVRRRLESIRTTARAMMSTKDQEETR